MPSFEDTVKFIQQAHAGQTDRAGQPYWRHPVQVAGTVKKMGGGEDEQVAALLHDVLEDTELNAEDLLHAGFTPPVINMVRWVTRGGFGQTGTYMEWIQQIAEQGPLGAVRIKLADNMSNMREGVTPSLAKRYERSMEILRHALENRNA